MQILDISSNNITDIGTLTISEYLATSKTPKEIYISNNKITNDGITNITEAIQTNTTLKLLDISHNCLSKDRKIVRTLKSYLKHNNTLQVLGILWDDTNATCVYVIGINSKCYVANTWPRSERTNNTGQCVCEYEELNQGSNFNYQPEFNRCINDTVPMKFNDPEATVLTALLYNNFNVSLLEIVRCVISDEAAAVINEFLKTNKTI